MKKIMVFLISFFIATEAFAGGPWQVMFQNIKLPTQFTLEHQGWVAPGSSNPTALVNASSLSNGVAKNLTSFLAQPDFARNVVIEIGGSGPSAGSGTAVVTGKNILGQSITESISLQAGVSGDFAGSKAFASISSVTIPAPSAPGVTASVGYGNKLGITRCAARAGDYVFSEFGNAYDATRGVFASDATHVESNTFKPNTALDGANNVDLFYVQNYRCY